MLEKRKLYSLEISFKNEGKRQRFLDEKKNKEIITSKSAAKMFSDWRGIMPDRNLEPWQWRKNNGKGNI